MSKIKDLPTDTVKVVTMLRLDNGVVIDAEELTAEQRRSLYRVRNSLGSSKHSENVVSRDSAK